MKMIRKIALLIMIFMLSTAFSAYAADYATPTTGVAEITLSASATQVKAGDEITITISAKCDTGVGDFNSVLGYDNTKIKLLSVENHEYYSNYSGNDGEKQLISILYGNALGTEPTEYPTEVTEFVKLKFEVLDAVADEEQLNIKLSEIEFYDADGVETNPEDSEIGLTVGTAEPDDGTGDGAGDGADDGANDGAGEGTDDGANDGAGDGTDDGANDGAGDGTDDGADDGAGDGTGDGSDDGAGDGTDDGADDGAGDGAGDGKDDEKNDGKDDGKSDDKKDPTTANKPINNAGLEVYGFGLIAIIVVSGVLYTKYKKYNDIK